MNRIINCCLLGTLLLIGVSVTDAGAQTHKDRPPKVEIAFNRYHDHAAFSAVCRRLVAAYPQFLSMKSIGKSWEGRDMWMVTVKNDATGPEMQKPAMYIDANVHGNEIQGTEVCLYTLWYLMENYGHIDRVTKLVDRVVFYILPSVNPDGRDHWIRRGNSSSSSRSGVRPFDSDRDGLADEDPTNDLDGDGSIRRMRKHVPGRGTHDIDPEDSRKMIRVKPGKKGDWIQLGSEGIDDDGDGRLNEDGLGGYDMNRSNPADWQPPYVQSGAGDYPLVWSETRCIADFILAHPNIASLQSYHNAGGMILRGPGADYVPEYPAADLRVYDRIGQDGAKALPFYRYMILYKDLYTVHGGFVNFAAETLGIISFTNELWSTSQRFSTAQRAADDQWKFNDLLTMGDFWSPWKPFDHPEYGKIEIGGWSKWSGRVNPGWLLEETCHRNTLFTLVQAEHMPEVVMSKPAVTPVSGDVKRVRVTIENKRLIPTRTALAAQKNVGIPDIVTIEGGRVATAGRVVGRFPNEAIAPIELDPGRVRLEAGIPSEGSVTLEWIVEGKGPFTIRYASEKGGILRASTDDS